METMLAISSAMYYSSFLDPLSRNQRTLRTALHRRTGVQRKRKDPTREAKLALTTLVERLYPHKTCYITRDTAVSRATPRHE